MKVLCDGITCPFRQAEIAYDFDTTSAPRDESRALYIFTMAKYIQNKMKPFLPRMFTFEFVRSRFDWAKMAPINFVNTWETLTILRMRKLYRLLNRNLV